MLTYGHLYENKSQYDEDLVIDLNQNKRISALKAAIATGG